MKIRLATILLLLLSFTCRAQEVDSVKVAIALPLAYTAIPQRMGKLFQDVLIDVTNEGYFKYNQTFKGNEHPDWTFLDFRNNKGQLTYVFKDQRAFLAILGTLPKEAMAYVKYLYNVGYKVEDESAWLLDNIHVELVTKEDQDPIFHYSIVEVFDQEKPVVKAKPKVTRIPSTKTKKR